MKLLINTANLHVGGGVQVASSFLTELSKIIESGGFHSDITVSVLCSDVVKQNLPNDFSYDVFHHFFVENIHGFKRPNKDVRAIFFGCDVCFTLFGPLYFIPKCKIHICGFAQAWISYPKNLAFSRLSITERIKEFIKYELQWRYFKKSDRLIVEQQHVKNSLIINRGYPESKVDIVENCVSSIYFSSPENWGVINNAPIDNTSSLTLGFLGRGYPHKNLAILSQVNDILISKYSLNVRFLFTLNNDEMKTLEFDRIPNFYTVGALNVSQCPSFFQLIDGLVFPSLLECFSATPIEAMLMRVPVFASDLPFVKDVCRDSAFYFDPLDPLSIADSIYQGLSDKKNLNMTVEKAYSYSASMPSAVDRAHKYIELMLKQL